MYFLLPFFFYYFWKTNAKVSLPQRVISVSSRTRDFGVGGLGDRLLFLSGGKVFRGAGSKRPEEVEEGGRGSAGGGGKAAQVFSFSPVFYLNELMPSQAQPESVPEAFCSRDIPEENQRSPEGCALIERP